MVDMKSSKVETVKFSISSIENVLKCLKEVQKQDKEEKPKSLSKICLEHNLSPNKMKKFIYEFGLDYLYLDRAAETFRKCDIRMPEDPYEELYKEIINVPNKRYVSEGPKDLHETIEYCLNTFLDPIERLVLTSGSGLYRAKMSPEEVNEKYLHYDKVSKVRTIYRRAIRKLNHRKPMEILEIGIAEYRKNH